VCVCVCVCVSACVCVMMMMMMMLLFVLAETTDSLPPYTHCVPLCVSYISVCLMLGMQCYLRVSLLYESE
jgi:hypothetical protein